MKKAIPLGANIVAQLLFGFAMYFIRRGMQAVGQDTIKYLAFRFDTALICMSLLIALGVFRVDYRGKPLKYLLLCGLCNPLISQVLESTATVYAPTAQIAMLNSTIPIVVILIGVTLFHEKTTGWGIFFCCVSVFGVFLTSVGPMRGSTVIGVVLIAFLVIAVAFGRIYLRKVRETFSAIEAIYATTSMGAVGFTVWTLVSHGRAGTLSQFFDGLWRWDFVSAVLYMGICSSVIAFSLTAYSAAYLPMEVYAALNTICTVTGMWVGAAAFHEHIDLLDIIGTGVILCGVIGTSLAGAKQPAQAAVSANRQKGP